MKHGLVRVLVWAGAMAFAAVWPVRAQNASPWFADFPIGAITALPGQEIGDSVATKTVEAIDVTLLRAGDRTPISRFTSAPCACEDRRVHELRFPALAPGLYEIDLHARDADVTQELSVTTFGTIALIDEREGFVMPVDLRTGRIRHDVALSLKDAAGEVAIPIRADGLGHTNALTVGSKTLIARASDGSVVSQQIWVEPRNALRAYSFFDRTTYRPGDPVYFTTISRFGPPDERTPFLLNEYSVVVPAATEIYKSSCCVVYAFRIPVNTKPGYYSIFPAGTLYVEPHSDSNVVDATPLRSHYNIGEAAVFAVSNRAQTPLRYEIWLQNNTNVDVTKWRPNVLLASGNVVPDKSGIAKVSTVIKKQATKLEARFYEPHSSVPVYVAFADITAHFVQSDLGIPKRGIVGQPLPMIALGEPLSTIYLRIYGRYDTKTALFEAEKRADANGYALFTWYPSADGLYRAEASGASPKSVLRYFTVGPADARSAQITNVNAVAMPLIPHVAPGHSNPYLVFAPEESDALVRWSNGRDFNVNVQRVGPVSRVFVPDTSDMVYVEMLGAADLRPWRISTSFYTEPQPHQLRVQLIPMQHGVRINTTDSRGVPVAARVIITVRKAFGAALLAPYDDNAAYDALYHSTQLPGPPTQISWSALGSAAGALATPTPEPTLGPGIPISPPAAAPTMQPDSQTLYFNPFVETDASGTADVTFPWSSSDAPQSAIITALAVTDDLRIGQAHSIVGR